MRKHSIYFELCGGSYIVNMVMEDSEGLTISTINGLPTTIVHAADKIWDLTNRKVIKDRNIKHVIGVTINIEAFINCPKQTKHITVQELTAVYNQRSHPAPQPIDCAKNICAEIMLEDDKNPTTAIGYNQTATQVVDIARKKKLAAGEIKNLIPIAYDLKAHPIHDAPSGINSPVFYDSTENWTFTCKCGGLTSNFHSMCDGCVTIAKFDKAMKCFE